MILIALLTAALALSLSILALVVSCVTHKIQAKHGEIFFERERKRGTRLWKDGE